MRRPLPSTLYVELLLCFGPTSLCLLSGVILFPHQVLLWTRSGAEGSWPVVLYFPGIVCLLIAVSAIVRRLRSDAPKPLQPWVFLALVLGLAALLLGPIGTFALMGYRGIGAVMWVLFIVLPIGCILHLVLLLQRHLSCSRTSPSPAAQ